MPVNKSDHGSRYCAANFLRFAGFVVVAVTQSEVALAYVGPGAGVTMLGALWAVVAGILLGIAGLLIWPIRAFLHRRKAAQTPNTGSESPANSKE
jgi:hypothetical protein